MSSTTPRIRLGQDWSRICSNKTTSKGKIRSSNRSRARWSLSCQTPLGTLWFRRYWKRASQITRSIFTQSWRERLWHCPWKCLDVGWCRSYWRLSLRIKEKSARCYQRLKTRSLRFSITRMGIMSFRNALMWSTIRSWISLLTMPSNMRGKI